MIQLQSGRISSDTVKLRFYPANNASLSPKSIFLLRLFPQKWSLSFFQVYVLFWIWKTNENAFNIFNSQNASLSRRYSISILNIWG